jgi:hypothetical protein
MVLERTGKLTVAASGTSVGVDHQDLHFSCPSFLFL